MDKLERFVRAKLANPRKASPPRHSGPWGGGPTHHIGETWIEPEGIYNRRGMVRLPDGTIGIVRMAPVADTFFSIPARHHKFGRGYVTSTEQGYEFRRVHGGAIPKYLRAKSPNPTAFSKERREHPTLPARTIRRIVSDHRRLGNPGGHEYEVVVGNIGSVYRGKYLGAALIKFVSYKQQSKDGYGRAAGESVTLFQDGEPIKEYQGTLGNPLTAKEAVRFLGDARAYRDMAAGYPRSKFSARTWYAGRGNGIAHAVHDATKDETIRSNARNIAEQTNRVARGMRTALDNPPGSKLIGRRVTTIQTTGGTMHLKGNCPLYGMSDGSILIRGFFAKIPKGYVKTIEYMDEAKAKREGMKNPNLPWRHDFTTERRPLARTRGGLIIRRGKRPLWGMR